MWYSSTGNLHFIDFSMTPILNLKDQVVNVIPEGRDITNIKLAEENLKEYNEALERVVKERIEELESTLEEYKAVNDELFVKNEELASINEEIKEKQILIEKLLKEKELSNKELVKSNNSLTNTLKTLQETQDQLIQSEKMVSLGTLTAGIAHEINNPINFISSGISGFQKCLTAISGAYSEYIEALESSKKSDDFFNQLRDKYNLEQNLKGTKLLSDNIRVGVVRTTEIINSLRSYIRTDNMKKSKVNIHLLIEDVLKMLYHEYKNRIEITKVFCDDRDINCLPGKIIQLFMNILSNAIQAIEGNGNIRIGTKILDDSKNKIQITISDNGSGMSKETIKKVFDPFFTTKPIGKGTGLGMSIAFNIVKEHKGDIQVQSEFKKGTIFIISLPVE